jgi:hypothetical protein
LVHIAKIYMFKKINIIRNHMIKRGPSILLDLSLV